MNQETINLLISWIRNYINNSGAHGVVLGMSGGKDSLIVAKLCCEALGSDKVYGVIMPNGKMQDKSIAEETCKLLNINYTIINIEESYLNILQSVENIVGTENVSNVTKFNIAPRIRMTTLYAVAGSLGYLVANTSNLSESMVGYSTKWGDNVGDFAPLSNFTKSEVIEIGLMLGLPKEFVLKPPSDGITGKSDEESLGISYDNLDEFIRTGKENWDIKRIKELNAKSAHKRGSIASFENHLPNYLNKKKNS